jgi:hypothetical protein
MEWYTLTEKEQGEKLGHQRDRTVKSIEQHKKDLEALKAPSELFNNEFRALEKKYYAMQASLEDIQRLQSDKYEAVANLQMFVDYVDSGEWRNDPPDKVSYDPHY